MLNRAFSTPMLISPWDEVKSTACNMFTSVGIIFFKTFLKEDLCLQDNLGKKNVIVLFGLLILIMRSYRNVFNFLLNFAFLGPDTVFCNITACVNMWFHCYTGTGRKVKN